MRGDFIPVFKMVHGFDNVDISSFFKFTKEVNPHDTRGHDYKIFTPSLSHVGRHHFFDYRIIDEWNSLPANTVKKQALSTFKTKIGSFYQERWFN